MFTRTAAAPADAAAVLNTWRGWNPDATSGIRCPVSCAITLTSGWLTAMAPMNTSAFVAATRWCTRPTPIGSPHVTALPRKFDMPAGYSVIAFASWPCETASSSMRVIAATASSNRMTAPGKSATPSLFLHRAPRSLPDAPGRLRRIRLRRLRTSLLLRGSGVAPLASARASFGSRFGIDIRSCRVIAAGVGSWRLPAAAQNQPLLILQAAATPRWWAPRWWTKWPEYRCGSGSARRSSRSRAASSCARDPRAEFRARA